MTSLLNLIAENWYSWHIAMLWQMAVLVGIIWLVDLCIRKWAWPQVRYTLWMLVLVKLLIPPTWTSPASVTSYIPAAAQKAVSIQFNPASQSHETKAATGMERINAAFHKTTTVIEQPETYAQNDVAYDDNSLTVASTPAGTVTNTERVEAPLQKTAPAIHLSRKTYAMFIWLAGIMVLSVWLIRRLTGLRREYLNASTQQLPERFDELLAAVAGKLNLKTLPQVILTNKVCCPAVFGILRPVLLMPARKFTTMSRQDTEHILLHELAHIKRGDLWVHAIHMILQILYWFNPLIWLARKPLQNLRELCCDATVAKLLKEKTYHYRETLLETARQLLTEPVDPGLGLLGLFENSNWLVTRLQWLEKKTWKNRGLRIATIILLVALMTTCVLPMANRQKPEHVAVLDNGAMIELIAVNYLDADSGWWQPDGNPCDVAIETKDYSQYEAENPGYELIFKIDGIKNRRMAFLVKGGNPLSGITVKNPDGLIGWRCHIKPRYKDTTVQVGILGDNWETVASHTGYGTAGTNIGRKKILLSPAVTVDSAFSITASDDLPILLGKRIVAVGQNNQVYEGNVVGDTSISQMHQLTCRFDGIERNAIKEFQFQMQEYTWVKFRDVALRPQNEGDFKVTGTVTDAETGEPIVGAKVYDDGYNNNKYHTKTDGNGSFTLKTANEEHMVSAKAAGYQPQSKTLLTSPLANNKNFNFALEPAAIATLDQIVKQADSEARVLNHEYIGTEHLLLALAADQETAAFVILKGLGIDIEKVRLEVNKFVKAGTESVKSKKLPLTPRAERALEYAEEEARSLGQDSVRSEHILLGLIRVQDGVAAKVLKNLGVNDRDVYGQMVMESKHVTEKTQKSDIPAEYIGHWKGQAKIVVGWTKQKELPIDITILGDGMVTGSVGDAALVNGRLVKKSWIYTGVFQHENPYRIEGDLQGDIIKAEGIRRDSIMISLRVEDGKIDGGLGTSGKKTGGKETMILSAADVSLERIAGNIENSKLKTTISPFTAILNNGVTVELVGTCQYSDGGVFCYRPDGKPLGRRLSIEKWNQKPTSGDTGLIYKISGPEDASLWYHDIEGADSTEASCSVVDENGEKLDGYEAVLTTFDRGRKTTTARFGAAAGAWKTVASYDCKSMGINNGISFTKAIETNKGLQINTTDTLGRNINHRLTAVDKAGNLHPWKGHTGSVRSNELRQSIGTFPNLKLEQVKEFQFQTRPYKWVIFKNISLRSDVITDVRIEVEKSDPVAMSSKMSGTWFFDNPHGDDEQMTIYPDGKVVVWYSNGHKDETYCKDGFIQLPEYDNRRFKLTMDKNGEILKTGNSVEGQSIEMIVTKKWKRIHDNPQTKLLRPLTNSETDNTASVSSPQSSVRNPNFSRDETTTISSVEKIDLAGDDVIQVQANSKAGFNFPFYLFIPKAIDKNQQTHLLVEPNNTGTTSDDQSVHQEKALRMAKNGYPNKIAGKLGSPLLVPTFPRPQTNWQAYTHSLDRDTLQIKDGKLRRIDLQLTAMIKYAQELLRVNGYKLHDQIFMHGFSASAKFCNRYAYLHPEKVKAVAAGGVNGLPTLPVSKWNENELPFPIGTAGIEEFTNAPFNEKTFRKVAHYIYMGAFDRNDTLPSRDAWSEKEAEIIKTALAETMMPDRWQLTQKIYKEQSMNAQCVTYNGIAHTIKDEMLDDVVKFFKANSGPKYVQIKPHQYPFVEYKQIKQAHINGLYWKDDEKVPAWIKTDLKQRTFLLGIEEWHKGQDHRQLDELKENAGFKFILKADGQKNIQIDEKNYGGNCSLQSGGFQAFYVNLKDSQFEQIVPGVSYRLEPVNESKEYVWMVNDDVTLTLGGKTDRDNASDDGRMMKDEKPDAPSTESRVQNVSFKKDMLLKDALRFLSEMYKVNIVPSQEVTNSRSVIGVTNLYDVNFEEVLQALCGTEHTYEIKGEFVYVYTNEEYKALRLGSQAEGTAPKIVSIYPPEGTEMALVSQLELTFDRPMMPDKFEIYDSSLEGDRKRWGEVNSLRSFVSYDSENYVFKIPLFLPSNWNGIIKLEGFKSISGAELEPFIVKYSTLREPFSAGMLTRFQKAQSHPELKDVLMQIKKVCQGLNSLQAEVYSRLKLSDEYERKITFKIQEDKQFYADMSHYFGNPWIIGSDGQTCWFYHVYKNEKELDVLEYGEIQQKNISLCDLFGLRETSVEEVLKSNNLEYAGTKEVDGRNCHIVHNWKSTFSHDSARCYVETWFVDAETLMLLKMIAETNRSATYNYWYRYSRINERFDDSEFKPESVTDIAAKPEEPLGEGYDTRFINVIDGTKTGRMSVRWGKKGPGGTSSSGLN